MSLDTNITSIKQNKNDNNCEFILAVFRNTADDCKLQYEVILYW